LASWCGIRKGFIKGSIWQITASWHKYFLVPWLVVNCDLFAHHSAIRQNNSNWFQSLRRSVGSPIECVCVPRTLFYTSNSRNSKNELFSVLRTSDDGNQI
jgi:hypothetical protein